MINLDHPWFDEMKGPHPLPVVQQSIDFIQGMRSELRAARDVIAALNSQKDMDVIVEFALAKYFEVTRD